MKPMPQAKFDETLHGLKVNGLIVDELDGGIAITDRGDAYLERLMYEKPELFVLMFLFYLQNSEDLTRG